MGSLAEASSSGGETVVQNMHFAAGSDVNQIAKMLHAFARRPSTR